LGSKDARETPAIAPSAGSSGAAEALHDVSNALTVVLGWLEEASREGTTDDHRAHAIEVAARKAREARALARGAIGARDEDDGPRAVSVVVNEVVDALAVELDKHDVHVVVSGLEGTNAQVRIPASMSVAHILTNLLLNALSFAPRGSTVRVTTSCGNAVEITVADEGPGIEPSVMPKLFEGGTSRPGGVGIGLRHSREVARKLEGDLLHVPGGHGATFVLRVPRARVTPPPPPRPSAVFRAAVEGARVLVVEDDRAVCALLDAGLGARGVEVVSLHDGNALGDKLATLGAFDAVLLDLSPIAHDLDGALAAVKQRLPNAGIVFISGSAVALEPELTRHFAQTRWVRKPFELGEIAAALAELLQNRA
jgi:CheY-like chemotaxis protein/two-component sensor histidine kinase